MSTSEVIPFRQISQEVVRWECPKCGNTCKCGSAYVRASERAAEAVAAHPEKSDRMIAEETGVGRMTVARIRPTVPSGTVAKRVGRDGKKRGGRRTNSGNIVKLRSEYPTISAAIRAGIEIDRDGGSSNDILAKSGLSVQTYRAGRDLVLLLDRDDLPAKVATSVRHAVKEMDATCQILPALPFKPFANKVWGEKGNRFKTENERLENFMASLASVITVCEAVIEVSIPHLSKQQSQVALAKLAEADAILAALRSRIQKEVRHG